MSKLYALKGTILCGGEGSRLRPLTYYFQKVMIPIGKTQKPLLEYIIKLFTKNGVNDVVLLVGYKAEQIINYFGSGKRFEANIQYVKDDPNFSGTGGALINAYLKGKLSKDGDILLYYGDILSNIDISSMYEKHKTTKAIATIAITKKYHVRVGIANLENDRIIGLKEKPLLDLPVTIGVIILDGKVLGMLKTLSNQKRNLDIMGDLIPYLIKKGELINAYFHDSFWYDVGSTERYEKLDYEIVDKFLGGIISN
jgi:mannose-1-phosphate guanylyltransferase